MLGNAFKGSRSRFCVVSFTSDWLFPTSDARQIGLIAQQVEKVAPYMISTQEGAEFDDFRVMSTQALP